MKKTISIIIGILFVFLAIGFYLFYLNKNVNNNQQNENVNISENVEKVENKIKIIAVGDSLTAGYGLDERDSYPRQLENKLLEKFKKVEVVNMGVSGETTAGLLDRTDFVLSQKPEMIIITIGGNDAFRNLPIEMTKENIEKIIDSFLAKVDKDKIFLAEIQAPLNLGFKYSGEFNSLFKNIAKSKGVKLLKFVDKEIFTNGIYMQGDGIHPNKAGYEKIINKYILDEVLKVI
jgi:acyl-CoA thioesterase-1